MKTDLYTKAVLTVIALMLAVIACNQYINPRVTAQAQAQSGFSSVQFSYDGGMYFFDSRTGEVWFYGTSAQARPVFKGRLVKLGELLTGH